MKFLLKIIALSSVLLLSVSSVFAIDAPANLLVTDITETSMILSWEAVDTAFGYHIYYSDVEGVEILSANKKEYITEIPVMIDGLEPNTEYYFIVSSFNEDGEESIFSEEVSFSTIGNQVQEKLLEEFIDEPMIEEVLTEETLMDEPITEIIEEDIVGLQLSGTEVLAQNQISLSFTSPLFDSEGAQREFKVVQKDDELNIFQVKESIVDPEDSTKVIVTFEDVLPVSYEYTVTVIDILDINGRNIESGIESFENFYLEESFSGVLAGEEEVITEAPQVQEVEIIPEDIGEIIPEDIIIDAPINGQNIDSEEILPDLNSAGAEAKTLPTTGPEHVFMLMLALIFGAMAFVFKFKKQ